MKRIITLFLIWMMAGPVVVGQTFLWEDFHATQMPPPGWSIYMYNDYWSAPYTNFSGCEPPEAMFTSTSGNGTTRLISPVLDLTGYTSIKLNFWHSYDDFSGTGPKVGVATRSGTGAWDTVWDVEPTLDIPPTEIDLNINNADVGSSQFQICFFVTGNLFNFWYWYVDNVLLYNPLPLDGGLTVLNVPPYIGDPLPVTGQMKNFGETTITSATIDWQIDGGPVHSTAFNNISIPKLGSYDFTCDGLITAGLGPHELEVHLSQVNGEQDDNPANDTLSMPIDKVSHTVALRPIFEEFTSSTCIPCAFFNTDFDPWCNLHQDSVTLVKYQMNWPAPGDIYYTAEGGARRDFYGVIFVPDLYLNGEQTGTDMTAVNAGYAKHKDDPGLARIAASYTVTGQTVNVDATVLPFKDMENMIVHTIVFENVTTGNIGVNGETEFHHVMMKMMPDSNGTLANLSDRVPLTITQSADLSGTHVEQYSDLGVAILVQDSVTKQIFQSDYALAGGTFDTEARLQMIDVNGTDLPGFDKDIYTYTLDLPQGSTIVPTVTAIPVDPNATVIILPALSLPGTTAIDVFAENLRDHHTYSVDFTVGVGLNNIPGPTVSLFPNPARGLVHILNAEGSSISVYTVSGSMVIPSERLHGNTLDLSPVGRGVFILEIETRDHSIVRKKVVLL